MFEYSTMDSTFALLLNGNKVISSPKKMEPGFDDKFTDIKSTDIKPTVLDTSVRPSTDAEVKVQSRIHVEPNIKPNTDILYLEENDERYSSKELPDNVLDDNSNRGSHKLIESLSAIDMQLGSRANEDSSRSLLSNRKSSQSLSVHKRSIDCFSFSNIDLNQQKEDLLMHSTSLQITDAKSSQSFVATHDSPKTNLTHASLLEINNYLTRNQPSNNTNDNCEANLSNFLVRHGTRESLQKSISSFRSNSSSSQLGGTYAGQILSSNDAGQQHIDDLRNATIDKKNFNSFTVLTTTGNDDLSLPIVDDELLPDNGTTIQIQIDSSTAEIEPEKALFIAINDLHHSIMTVNEIEERGVGLLPHEDTSDFAKNLGNFIPTSNRTSASTIENVLTNSKNIELQPIEYQKCVSSSTSEESIFVDAKQNLIAEIVPAIKFRRKSTIINYLSNAGGLQVNRNDLQKTSMSTVTEIGKDNMSSIQLERWLSNCLDMLKSTQPIIQCHGVLCVQRLFDRYR